MHRGSKPHRAPSNAGAECIPNSLTFWVNAGREANQAQGKEPLSQRPPLILPQQEGAGLAKLLTSSPTASPSIGGMVPGRCSVAPVCTSQLHPCLFLISGPWLLSLHSIPVPLVPQGLSSS